MASKTPINPVTDTAENDGFTVVARKTKRQKPEHANNSNTESESERDEPNGKVVRRKIGKPTSTVKTSVKHVAESKKKTEKAKIPPITVFPKGNLRVIDINKAFIKECTPDNLLRSVKTRDGTKLHVSTAKDYIALQRFLDNKNVPHFIHKLPQERPKEYVIKGKDEETQTDEVLDELRFVGYPILRVAQFKSVGTKLPLPIFLAEFEAKANDDVIKKLTSHLTMEVTVVPYKQAPTPLRCFKCQGFGHSAHYCMADPRCVKCQMQHSSKECSIERPLFKLGHAPPSSNRTGKATGEPAPSEEGGICNVSLRLCRVARVMGMAGNAPFHSAPWIEEGWKPSEQVTASNTGDEDLVELAGTESEEKTEELPESKLMEMNQELNQILAQQASMAAQATLQATNQPMVTAIQWINTMMIQAVNLPEFEGEPNTLADFIDRGTVLNNQILGSGLDDNSAKAIRQMAIGRISAPIRRELGIGITEEWTSVVRRLKEGYGGARKTYQRQVVALLLKGRQKGESPSAYARGMETQVKDICARVMETEEDKVTAKVSMELIKALVVERIRREMPERIKRSLRSGTPLRLDETVEVIREEDEDFLESRRAEESWTRVENDRPKRENPRREYRERGEYRPQ
ncbi:hypothetical protein AAG570_000843 [Ranatra chinensis]|uniref:Gag-like protein n=1 Tax=Ranatra chinensis TaxID=642074 RepID=A0ABD0YY99_9HEMI